MIKEPTGDEPTTTPHNGKTYWWCPQHNSFGRHQTADCKGKGAFVKKKAASGGTPREKKFATAMSAFLGNDEEDDDEPEQE